MAFLRKYKLSIGRPNSVKSTPDGETTSDSSEKPNVTLSSSIIPIEGGFVDLQVVPSTGLIITEHNIVATATYSKEKAGKNKQPATIEIYNLSKDEIEQIRANDTVVLEAGYADEGTLPIIYVGQIISATTSRKGEVDFVTKILCGDGHLPQNDIKISKVFPSGSRYSNILLELTGIAARFGIPFGKITSNEGDDTAKRLNDILNKPYPVMGNLFSILNKICNSIGYKWYISLGRLYIEPEDAVGLVDLVVINQENIIGGITPSKQAAGKAPNSKDAKAGVVIPVWLNGNITINKFARVVDDNYGGDYKIETVQHKFGSDEGDSMTTLTCRRLN